MANWLSILSAALVVINIIAFILVGMDKKRSVDNADRIRAFISAPPQHLINFLSVPFARMVH